MQIKWHDHWKQLSAAYKKETQQSQLLAWALPAIPVALLFYGFLLIDDAKRYHQQGYQSAFNQWNKIQNLQTSEELENLWQVAKTNEQTLQKFLWSAQTIELAKADIQQMIVQQIYPLLEVPRLSFSDVSALKDAPAIRVINIEVTGKSGTQAALLDRLASLQPRLLEKQLTIVNSRNPRATLHLQALIHITGNKGQ